MTAAQIILTDQLSDADRTTRPAWAKSFYDANPNASKATLIYLEELLYFVPVHMALQLQSSGVYIEALDWLSQTYDYRLPAGAQLAGLPPEPPGTTSGYQRNLQTWLLDPLNPHSIAETRQGAYTRFTLLAIINCLLAYADSEYTADTPETVPRARELYERALALVGSPDLAQSLGTCAQMIGELQITVDDPHWSWFPHYLTAALRSISDATTLKRRCPRCARSSSRARARRSGRSSCCRFSRRFQRRRRRRCRSARASPTLPRAFRGWNRPRWPKPR